MISSIMYMYLCTNPYNKALVYSRTNTSQVVDWFSGFCVLQARFIFLP